MKSEQFAIGKNIHHMSTSQARHDENLWFELEGSVGILVNLKKRNEKKKKKGICSDVHMVLQGYI